MNWLREPDSEPLPGYILVEPIGTGGFGAVWKCVAPGGIHKAIKFVYGNLNSLDDDRAKAEQEFKALERVKAVRHPFVLSNERIDIVSGELLIVMELADKSLHDVMLECQNAGLVGVPRQTLLGYVSDAAEGLDHLIEKHNLQHLDVKPKNLFLIGERVKVADFGLVKHLERASGSGLLGGITPIYAAPETFSNKISKHSDQYSLAVLYTELLSGKRPFNGKNIRQLAMQHIAEAPDLSMLDGADREAVARALSKNPEERFPSCTAFVRALSGLTATPLPRGSGVTVAGPRTIPEGDFGLDVTQSTPPERKSAATPVEIPASLLDRMVAAGAMHQSGSLSVSFRPDEGVLRPAILIGVGSFGRRALHQIRCRLLDRVGSLAAVPCIRFLAVDTDPPVPAREGAPRSDAALTEDQTFVAALKPATGYRRRQLDQLFEWLPREKLYSIPRSLRLGGSRALGRLAFSDHYLRFVTRFRHEVEHATHPDAVNQSARQTGLTTRTSVPSVYVFGSASGGSSGALLDLGHAVRRTLEKFHIGDAPVTAFLFAGAPDDPSSSDAELANTYATLTELHHFADPDVTFQAQYVGPDGPTVTARGLPFTATYLMPMESRSPEAFRDCVAHLAGYVSHDLTTPLGTGLEKVRRKRVPPGRTPFRGFGTFGVWYPRGLLLRSAARQACGQFLRAWAAFGQVDLPAEAEATLQGVLAHPGLAATAIQEFIAEQSSTAEGNPATRAREWVENLGDVPAARRADPHGWAVAAWDQCRDLFGPDPTTDADSPFRRGRLARALDQGLRRAVDTWRNELTELLRPLNELPGPRLAVAEAVERVIANACAEAAQLLDKQLQADAHARSQAQGAVLDALEACRDRADAAGFALIPGRAGRAAKQVTQAISTFAHLRRREDLALAASQFYRRLRTDCEERQRETTAARARVAALAGTLEASTTLPPTGLTTLGGENGHDTDAYSESELADTNTMRVVLPHGEAHLEDSAAEMLAALPRADLAQLELILTRAVIEPRGGLVGACRTSVDLAAALAGPLVDQATTFLGERVPGADVTAVELSAAGANPGELARRVASYVRAAVPMAHGPAEDEKTFVMVPETDAGRAYAEAVRAAIPGATAVPVPGTDTDLLFCREQGCLRSADLDRILEPCWEAYQQATQLLDTNPHSRFDISGWLPLVK